MEMEIKQNHNVKAVKGILKKTQPIGKDGNWSVSLAGRQLSDKQNLANLDFINHAFLAEFVSKD